jgi:hypothetical protein
MAMGPSEARCQEWLPAVSYCSALLLQRSLETAVRRVGGWCEMAAGLEVSPIRVRVERQSKESLQAVS